MRNIVLCYVTIDKIGEYQCNFATSKEWSRQSNVLDKSVKRGLKLLPVSIASLNFSIRPKRQCCALYLFPNSHWLENSISSKYS